MELNSLLQQIATVKQTLFDEGILNSQFLGLEQLDDNDNPSFLEQVFTVYFSESPKVIATIEEALEEQVCDFATVNTFLHGVKGSTLSIGATKATIQINQAVECFYKRDIKGCKAAIRRVKEENNTLTNRLQVYLQRVLDSQFTRMEEVDPYFAGEMTDLYFGEVPSFMCGIEKTLETIPLNVANLREYLGKFKGSSARIGASKVINVIDNMIDCCTMGNIEGIGANKATIQINQAVECCYKSDIEGCKAGFPNLKQAFHTLKKNLEPYLELLQQYKSSTSSTGPNENMVGKNK
ncbi:uncharacterized protein LOC132165201 [Corylus avellana]|uniref:uncharacterized protein LOC132165201 n=1 Tax=Corylus avellana TaxID=13451 RepID=UPI00286B4440|nr:uncharacterized protein LOC132165201 [Corylus avellana]